jgi:hypothetical protein
MASLRTLDAIQMHRSDPDAIVAAGELVDMSFTNGDALSLRSAKLFCLMVQEAGIDVAEDTQHRLPYSILNETFHLSKDELVESISELHKTTVSVQMVDGDGRSFTKTGPILSDVERETSSLDDAEIRFQFSPTMRRVISDSTHWASISRRAVLSFESRYTLRLYMWLCLRINRRQTSQEISLGELRDILGISSSTLPRWQDVKRRALEPAVAEITQLAGFVVGYTPMKRGRRMIGVRLAWGRKDTDGLIEAQKELDRPRIGRKARRDGLVETMAQERHMLAESLANAPALIRLTEPD